MKIQLNDRQYMTALLTPSLLFLLLFVAYPLVQLMIKSFYTASLVDPYDKSFIGLANYSKAFLSSRVTSAMLRTLLYTIIAIALEFFLGFSAALLFHEFGEKSSSLRTLFLFPLMIPPIVAGLLWRYLLVDNFGILNSTLFNIGLLQSPHDIAWLSDSKIVLFSVTLPNIWLTTSFVTMMLYTGLQGISKDIEEAAEVDGARYLTKLFRIRLPLLRPIIAVTLIIRGLDAARTFDMIWIMTEGGPNFQSEILSLNIYRTIMRYDHLGLGSALGVIFMVGLLLFSLLLMLSIWNPRSSRHMK